MNQLNFEITTLAHTHPSRRSSALMRNSSPVEAQKKNMLTALINLLKLNKNDSETR